MQSKLSRASSSILRAAVAVPRQAGRHGRLAVAVPPCLRAPARQHFKAPAAAASDGEPSEPAASGSASQGSSSSSSSGNDSLPRAVSLPMGVPTAGAVFVMAGFLKILVMCFPFSEMAIMMYVQGRADLGMGAALKAIPLALGLAVAAKALVDRQLQTRKWAPLAIGAVGVLLLFLSRMVFARPRPSPLDPMFRQLNQERTAVVAEQRRSAAEAQQRRHLLQQPDAERGRALQQEQQQRAARRQ